MNRSVIKTGQIGLTPAMQCPLTGNDVINGLARETVLSHHVSDFDPFHTLILMNFRITDGAFQVGGT